MAQDPQIKNPNAPTNTDDSSLSISPVYLNAPVSQHVLPDSHWDLATKRTVLVILLVVGVGIFWISRPVLSLLIVGGIVAYLLSPIVDLCQRLRIPRSVSTIILFLLLLVALIFTPVLLLPVLLTQLSSLTFNVPYTANLFVGWMQRTVANLPPAVEILGFTFDLTGFYQGFQASINQDLTQQWLPTPQDILSYINQAIGTATSVLSTSVNVGFSVVGGVFTVLFYFFVLFFISLYLTKDAPKIRAYIEGLFPRAYQSELGDLFSRIGHIWQAFFRGQIILSTSVGVATWLALTLAGMPGALILAILAGSLEIIPNLGPIIAMIPAVIVALIQGSDTLAVGNFTFALLTVGIYFIIQQFENNLLVPRIIGNSVNLHPVVVICGVVIGASVGGVMGAFLAAPVIASLRMLGAYVYNKLIDNPVVLEPLPVRGNETFYRRVVRGDEVTREDDLVSATAPADEMTFTIAAEEPLAAATEGMATGIEQHSNGTGKEPISPPKAVDPAPQLVDDPGLDSVAPPAENPEKGSAVA